MNQATPCPACERAKTHPGTGLYTANCLPCEARALAQSPQAKKREADPSELQAAMRRMWPTEDEYRRGRAEVWAWIGKLSKETTP